MSDSISLNVDISVKWFGERFNVNFARGGEDFASVRGCRIVNGREGEFVSPPASKNEKTDKWWNHAWFAGPFSDKIIEMAKASKPDEERQAIKDEPKKEELNDPIPF